MSCVWHEMSKSHSKKHIPLLSSVALAPRPPSPLAPFACAFSLIACAQHETTQRQNDGNDTHRFFLSSASLVSRKMSLRRCSNDRTSSGTSAYAARCLPLDPTLSQLLSTAAGRAAAEAPSDTASTPATTACSFGSFKETFRRARDCSIAACTNGCSAPLPPISSLLLCF